MELDAFKKCYHKYFKEHGFKKIKNRYYLKSNDLLCEIYVQRSYFAQEYYFNYDLFIGDFQEPYVINRDNPRDYTPGVDGRFYFTEIDTFACEYTNYTEAQLIELLDKNYNEIIRPPMEYGKKYILENFGTIYSSTINPEKAKQALLDT